MKNHKLLLFSILFCFIFNARAIEVKSLVIMMDDLTEAVVPVYGDVALSTDEDENLIVESEYADYVLPLQNVKEFFVSKTDLPAPPEDAGVDSITPDNINAQWTIYSDSGVLVAKGCGVPDLSNLTKGKIYIVNQGSLKYKIIAR